MLGRWCGGRAELAEPTVRPKGIAIPLHPIWRGSPTPGLGGYVSALYLRGRIVHPVTLKRSVKVYHVHIDTGAMHSMFPEEVLVEGGFGSIDRGPWVRVFMGDQPDSQERRTHSVDFEFGPCEPEDRRDRLSLSEQQMREWKGTCVTSYTTRGALSPACLAWTRRPDPICAGSQIHQRNDHAGPPIILLGMDLLSRWHLDLNGAEQIFHLVIPA